MLSLHVVTGAADELPYLKGVSSSNNNLAHFTVTYTSFQAAKGFFKNGWDQWDETTHVNTACIQDFGWLPLQVDPTFTWDSLFGEDILWIWGTKHAKMEGSGVFLAFSVGFPKEFELNKVMWRTLRWSEVWWPQGPLVEIRSVGTAA